MSNQPEYSPGEHKDATFEALKEYARASYAANHGIEELAKVRLAQAIEHLEKVLDFDFQWKVEP